MSWSSNRHRFFVINAKTLFYKRKLIVGEALRKLLFDLKGWFSPCHFRQLNGGQCNILAGFYSRVELPWTLSLIQKEKDFLKNVCNFYFRPNNIYGQIKKGN